MEPTQPLNVATRHENRGSRTWPTISSATLIARSKLTITVRPYVQHRPGVDI